MRGIVLEAHSQSGGIANRNKVKLNEMLECCDCCSYHSPEGILDQAQVELNCVDVKRTYTTYDDAAG